MDSYQVLITKDAAIGHIQCLSAHQWN
jgi:hypothetical protein